MTSKFSPSPRTSLGRAVVEDVNISDQIQENLRVPDHISPAGEVHPRSSSGGDFTTGCGRANTLLSREKPKPVT